MDPELTTCCLKATFETHFVPAKCTTVEFIYHMHKRRAYILLHQRCFLAISQWNIYSEQILCASCLVPALADSENGWTLWSYKPFPPQIILIPIPILILNLFLSKCQGLQQRQRVFSCWMKDVCIFKTITISLHKAGITLSIWTWHSDNII